MVNEKKSSSINIAPSEESLGGGGYFDLGAQLEDGEKLNVTPDKAALSQSESSLGINEVFEGIRKGIDEKPKEEASRLHYELGIAYQQMERVDDAIEEFKKALDNQEVKNDCFRRLAACFREKEMYKHAINAARSGLKSRFISQNEFLGLHYELGLAYAEMGETKKALEVFQEIEKVNTHYKDTKKIVQELSKG